MSFFSGIISGAKALFGVNENGGGKLLDAAKGVGDWIDEQQFTEQESKEYKAKMIGHFQEFMKLTVDENTERSRTRRELALWIIRVEMLFLVSSAVLYRIDELYAEFVFKLATHDPMNYLVLGIGAFFFGSHLIRATKGK